MKRRTPTVGRRGYPHLNHEYLETIIAHEDYHHFPKTGVTVCCLVAVNGYSVTEEAVCANTASFDPAVGNRRARRKALDELLKLEYYLLRQRLYESDQNPPGVPNGTDHTDTDS